MARLLLREFLVDDFCEAHESRPAPAAASWSTGRATWTSAAPTRSGWLVVVAHRRLDVIERFALLHHDTFMFRCSGGLSLIGPRGHGYGAASLYAINSAGKPGPPIARTTYCRPFSM